MKHLVGVVVWGALALAGLTGPAVAQYYAPAPPPPGYYPAPPPRHYPRRHRFFGRQCDALLPTGYGPERTLCPILRPRPLHAPCRCPPPPNYPAGPWLRGRVVR